MGGRYVLLLLLACQGCGTGGQGGAGVCPPGGARCNDEGLREVCSTGAAWVATDFVCTTNVAIDEEIGSVCATKADGRYLCWNADGGQQSSVPLVDAAYARVQLARLGPIGLTRGGEIFASGFALPPDLPAVAKFRATNMWGFQGYCFRSVSGEFLYGAWRDDIPSPEMQPWHVEGGPFSDGTCAFEGLYCAVTSDGSAWGNCSEELSGDDWKQMAVTVGFNCGLTKSGDVRCGSRSVGTFPPTFPSFGPGPYRQVASTYHVACALREDGSLSCLRADSHPLPAPSGPFTFIDAGLNLLCAIRADGTSSCFKHDGVPGLVFGDLTPTAFLPHMRAGSDGW
jgi:hypothetical protein